MDRVDEWRAFLAVAGRKSFVRAARDVGRSPQAITRAIASLEERLGARLFHRTTRSVSLTSDGERSLVRARRVVAELDELEAPADPRAPLTGQLSVTAPVLFGQLHVVPVLAELLAKQPALDARLLLVDRVVALAEEGVDVAVRIGALPDSALRARVVGHVRSVICASPAYLEKHGTPRAPESLAQHACIAFTGTTPVADRWSFPGRSRAVAVRPRLVVNAGQAALDAAVAGAGLVRVLSYQVDKLVAAGRLVVVLARFEPEPLPVHLVWLPGAQPRAASSFVELASDRLRARLS